MGREVRRVPANWEHPKNARGHYIPLFGGSFRKELAEWEEGARQWEKGLVTDGEGGWEPKPPDTKSSTYKGWDGPKPEEKDYMPDWTDAERTHYQMYETCTEGTPISPVMDTPENLARWLVDNKASAFADMEASYEHWLAMIKAGWAPSMMCSPKTGVISGVEVMGKHETKER